MVDHSMAITTSRNNGGGSKNHLPSPWPHRSAYRRALYGQNSGGPPGEASESMVPIVFVSITAGLVLLRLLCCGLCKEVEEEEQEETGAGNGVGQQPAPPPPESNEGGERCAPDKEVAPPAEPPLVCTYRKADGWAEGSCGVCLADLADGEALRVLPACMHYFHAACVNEWLRRHDTCPLCRAPLVTPRGGP